MKLVINKCYGGFGLSHEAVLEYAKIKGIEIFAFIETSSNFRNPEYTEYTGQEGVFMIHYYTKPLKDGKRQDDSYFYDGNIKRDDPALVQVVENLGDKANKDYAQLEIVDIPDDVEWTIEEHDGNEWVAESHRTW